MRHEDTTVVFKLHSFNDSIARSMCRDTIREKLIPHAVSWYTGEAIEAEFDDEDEDDDDDEDEDEDDEDDEDEDDDEV